MSSMLILTRVVEDWRCFSSLAPSLASTVTSSTSINSLSTTAADLGDNCPLERPSLTKAFLLVVVVVVTLYQLALLVNLAATATSR